MALTAYRRVMLVWTGGRGRPATAIVAACAVMAMAACGSGSSKGSTKAGSAQASLAPAVQAALPNVKLPTPELTNVTMGISANDPHQFLLQLAQDEGLFQHFGINASVRFFDGTQTTTQAIIGGQVQVATNNASQSIQSLTTPRPLVDVGDMINKLPDWLYVSNKVHSPADLVGKKAAISQFGGQSNADIVAGLQALGLKPDGMKIVEVGGQSTRIAALEKGAIAMAPADPFNAATLAKAGFKPIVKLNESNEFFAGSNIQMQKAWVQKNPNTALAVLAAALVAQQTEFTDTAYVAQQYAKFAKLSSADASQAFDQYLKSGICQRDLRSTRQAYENDKSVLGAINKNIASVDAFQAYDPSLLDRLDSLGFKVNTASS